MDDKDGLEDEWKDRCRVVPTQYYNQTWIWMTRMDWKMNERIDVEKYQDHTITKHEYGWQWMDWKMNERIDVDAGDEKTDSEKKVSIFNLKRENDTI